MKGTLFCFLLALQIVSLAFAAAAKRPFLSTHAISHPAKEKAPHSSPPPPPQYTKESKKLKSLMGIEGISKAKEEGNVSKIGSSPPKCEHKCYGCVPCEAIQVPSKSSHLGIQYANYEPESWKCKCGLSFYGP